MATATKKKFGGKTPLGHEEEICFQLWEAGSGRKIRDQNLLGTKKQESWARVGDIPDWNLPWPLPAI